MKYFTNKSPRVDAFVATAVLMCLLTALMVLFTDCADRFPSEFILEMPKTPDAWVAILGEPHWHVEWIDPDGKKQMKDFPPGRLKNVEIKLPVTCTNPVTAWPYWPLENLPAKSFKPCGALFPFDADGDRLQLSWKAGADSIFYWELALAYKENSGSAIQKTPDNFDWPRFRELFKSDALSDAVRKDKWVVNWKTAAEKTAESNFDRRRIVPEAVIQKTIPVPSGTWYGTSPFAEPLFFEEGETAVFPVRSGINIWISEKGILKVDGNTWVFAENKLSFEEKSYGKNCR